MIPGLPRGPRTAAFTAIVAAIQDAPAFRNGRVVRTWLVHEKSASEVSVDMMPAVRLTLIGGEIERLATVDMPGGLPAVDVECRPTLVVETWVKGADVRDAMDLYDALDAALFPEAQIERAALFDRFTAVGLSDWRPAREVLPEVAADYAASSIHSAGTYQFTLNLTQ